MTSTRRPRSQRRGKRHDETSAGGLVVDTERMAAAIIGRVDRKGRMVWSMPKGHLENGETAEQAAIREVAEETGIHATITGPLGTISFWFMQDGKRIHKTVHHFLLIAHGGELSDEDVEVDAIEWIPLAQVAQRLSYADERAFLPKAFEMLGVSA